MRARVAFNTVLLRSHLASLMRASTAALALSAALAYRAPLPIRLCASDVPSDVLSNDEIEDAAIRDCRLWISKHILRLGLCPFASTPFVEEKIRYAVTEATSDEELVEDFFVEGRLLLDSDADELATTMLIAPNYAASIEEYSDLYGWLTDTLEDESETLLENGVQPAFFHPHWNFEGLPNDDPINFEKRAPMPVVNLLRRADLDAVVEQGLAKGRIVNRDIAEHNAAALEAEGFDALVRSFHKHFGSSKSA